ncbi:hypothetical protein FSC37_03600 [Piscinibacter aquaticus]|uniref:Dystroglycan-type cadherin-like domain-containing protein n=1 Tax=Piscinibacter aquaticus TaxID=392597 RepID=A0A5C6U5M8_9BURK|nr:hypothetical protein FSC37_03600 [Piscinibacter aquaticus]
MGQQQLHGDGHRRQRRHRHAQLHAEHRRGAEHHAGGGEQLADRGRGRHCLHAGDGLGWQHAVQLWHLPALPAGLSFNTSTGQVSGTPSAASASTTYTVTVTDGNGSTSSKTFTLSVGGCWPRPRRRQPTR